jgi:hypothetical protein
MHTSTSLMALTTAIYNAEGFTRRSMISDACEQIARLDGVAVDGFTDEENENVRNEIDLICVAACTESDVFKDLVLGSIAKIKDIISEKRKTTHIMANRLLRCGNDNCSVGVMSSLPVDLQLKIRSILW